MGIIIAGSEGVIGKQICSMFVDMYGEDRILLLDKSLGHNLSDESSVKNIFQSNSEAKYLINLFALNDHVDDSGKTKSGLFDVSLDSVDEYLKINLTSLFSVCREFARTRENGAIVNFSSTYGLVSPCPSLYDANSPKHIGYCISKAGVLQLTKYLAVHLAPNFRVNTVVPGGVLHKQGEGFVSRYSEATPLKRMMNSSELFGILKYLCSEDSSYTTGATFVVDGGWTIK